MADNDQNNDEYKFVELDGLDNSMMDELEPNEHQGSTNTTTQPTVESGRNTKRNAIIAIVLVLIAMLMYKAIGYLVVEKKKSDVLQNQPINPQTQPVQPQEQEPVSLVPTPPPTIIQADNTEITRKVAAVELAQENVRSEVGAVSQQVGIVNNNVNTLNSQIANLNQVIGTLSTQIAKQSDEINELMARTKPKPKMVKRMPQMSMPTQNYAIQAVIPGRAWLIATNGSTITVREGTNIAGYGVVKLIDSLDGRVITSSGRIIRFSQEDS